MNDTRRSNAELVRNIHSLKKNWEIISFVFQCTNDNNDDDNYNHNNCDNNYNNNNKSTNYNNI